MKPPFIRSEYNYDMADASNQSGLACKDPSKTDQSGAEATDINYIVKRFSLTGEIPQLQRPPLNADFESVPDFQTAMNLIVEANRSFAALPADIRSRFDNDPGNFVNFCSNEANRDEMRQMGLWSDEAVKTFELQAQTAADLAKANAEAAEELKALKGQKGDTQKGVT